MATEKQIAANRNNAQKSTGPKTAAGRLKSSRNAYRHGLSLPLHLDMSTSAKADAIARALADDQSDEEELAAAAEVARAHLELLRIRAARAELMSEVDLCRPQPSQAVGGARPLRTPRRYQAATGIL